MGRREFKVGVFRHQGKRSVRYAAYTTWFNPSWDGCTVMTVEAENGAEAKRMAIDICRLSDATRAETER